MKKKPTHAPAAAVACKSNAAKRELHKMNESTKKQEAPEIESADQVEVKKWLEIRKEAGRKIDPWTAEVTWTYAEVLDPYGIEPELPEDGHCIGREYFARSPGSDVWVWFGDLPDATRNALDKIMRLKHLVGQIDELLEE